MISTIYNTPKDELYHFGIKGMKWGVRRYQNEDGTYTEAGKERYSIGKDGKISSKEGAKNYLRDHGQRRVEWDLIDRIDNYESEFDNTPEGKRLRKENDDFYDKNWMKEDEDTNWDEFYDIRDRMASASGEYAFKKIQKEYGDYLLSEILPKSEKDTIKKRYMDRFADPDYDW